MSYNNQAILGGFLSAIAAWRLDVSDAARLIGVDGATVREWQAGQPCSAPENVWACMLMLAKIRTALDICWSAPLCNEWVTLRNKGNPYSGLSPLAYMLEHGWSGIFWVLCHVQARAVGN